MKTFILFWNPEISSYKLSDFQEDLENIGYADMNWSVYEHEAAASGDRFFMVRCGEGKTGVCASGYFSSDPTKDENWRGKGEPVYYMGLQPDAMLNPDYTPILTTDELCNAIPSFDWKGGHSGRLIEPALAEKLETMWKNFLEEHKDASVVRAAFDEVDPTDFPSVKDDVQVVYLSLEFGDKIRANNEPCNIDFEGSDIEKVKQKAIKAVRNKAGKEVEIVFRYGFIDASIREMYGKALELYLARKSKKDKSTVPCTLSMEKIIYMLSKVFPGADELRSLGFSDEIIDAVVAYTRMPGETLLQHVKRAAKNPIATSMLIDILNDLLYINDKKSLDADTVKQLNEYLKAYHYLVKHGG